jgi:hypothetical protein
MTNRPIHKHARSIQPEIVRWVASFLILFLFWGALALEFWPDFTSTALRLINTARSVGSTPVSSRYFEVKNNSNASEGQVVRVMNGLEKQYEKITAYTRVTPPEKLPVLVVNGQGPTLMDGSELVISYDNGLMDTDLAPLFLVLMVEDIQIDPTAGLAQAGGYALNVVEATGLEGRLTRQPLDNWVALLQRSGVYVPLEEAWEVQMPGDNEGIYQLMRALLESGSFMRWISAHYGMEAAQRIAHGETVEQVTGKPLAELEALWLKALDQEDLHPKSCHSVIPKGHLFNILCEKVR